MGQRGIFQFQPLRHADAVCRANGLWQMRSNGAGLRGNEGLRTTGFVILLHLPERHTADEVEAEMIRVMTGLPERLRKTLTWDRGGEMANHAKITDATGLKIYFADPRSPWQRPSNENTNGLLRQYFPKGTDLSAFPRDYLDFVALRLNNRPRKRHDWLTPAEVLDELLSNPPQPPPVALTA